jgi:hypothetical protein
MQPESGLLVPVTRNSQRLLIVTVVLASDVYAWTPFVMTSVCALLVSGRVNTPERSRASETK